MISKLKQGEEAYRGAEIFQYVSEFSMVGEQVVLDRFKKESLAEDFIIKKLRQLVSDGFLYQPTPKLYARLIE